MQLPAVPIYAASTAAYSDEFPTPDILAVQFLVDQPKETGTLAVVYQHSADGINWLDKATLTLSPSSTITAGAVNALFTSDSGSPPALPRGRFKCTTATTTTCTIRPFISGRAY